MAPLRIHITAVLVCMALCSFCVQAEEISPFPETTVVIYGNGSAGPYTIEHEFIGGTVTADPSSVSDSLVVVETDIIRNTITFSRSLAEGDSVKVIFAEPPSWLKKTYRRSQTAQPPVQMRDEPYQSYRDKTPGYFPGLSFGGSKTFDVNVGSGAEAALNQTLRINITGKLTDDITLNAAISDQNVPITPEGDTRELEELDRVMIELKGSRFSADMGDTDLRHESGRWLSYMRRLSGARVSVDAGSMEVFGSAALSEGRHISTTIMPVEGNQGPYRLIADDGRKTISLIPGTETIWINGEQLTRGNNHDYTIDYSTGEVMFTEQKIIGSDMRIVCDYEYTTESYRRNFYSAGADGAFLDNRLKLGVVIAREADNSSKPVLYDLDESMRNELAQSGDTPASLIGIRTAEEDSTGLYDEVDGHLVYNPAGDGKFNASFSWVGEDNGSYRYTGSGIYEFVPPEQRIPGSGASYKPEIIVNGPVSHDLAGVTLSFDPVSFVHAETEFAGSTIDKNTLSGIDDSDNYGGAQRFGIAVSPELSTGIPIRLDIHGNYRSQKKNFSPLDRDRAAEENRDWGLPLISERRDETVSEVSGGLSLHDGRFEGSGFAVSTGYAEYGGNASSKRTGGSGNFLVRDRGEAHLNVNHINREDVPGMPNGTIDRVNFRANAGIAGFAPSVKYEHEKAENDRISGDGSSFDDILTAIKTPEFYGVTGDLEWFYRKERSKMVSWADSSHARGGSIGISTVRKASGLLRTRYSRRERITGAHVVTTDQALLDGYYRPENGVIRLDTTYRAGRSREASKSKNYIFTGTGRGGYRWEDENGDGIRDPDEFVPDEHGSYYLYEETLEDYRPVNLVSAYGKLGIDIPGRILRFIVTRDIPAQSETTVEINEKSTASTADIFLLNLSKFRKKGVTTSGDARIQQDVTVPIVNGTGNVRIRYFRYDSYSAEYVTGDERRGSQELSLRLRLPVTEEYDTEFTLRRSQWNRFMENRSAGDYRVNSFSGDAGISLYPVPQTKLGLTLGGGSDLDNLTSLNARYYVVKPSATYWFSGNGRIEASYAVTSVSLDNFKPGTRLPNPMARGQKDGRNHDISIVCDYRLSQRMNLIASYTGRKFGGKKFENFARAQVRALF